MNANNVISLLSLLYGYYYHLNKDTGKHEMKHHKWSYTGKTGPEYWVENYPKCGGRLQSPIDIMTSEVEPVTWLTPLEFLGYDRISGHSSKSFLRLHNNGDTASIEVKDKMYILGSNLRDRYRAAEIHFHWGEDYRTGAEHSINHHHYPLEIHFVHYNDRYGNLSEATKHKDGLAVIGVFADISREINLAFEHVSEALYKVREYDAKTELTGIRPMDLLPKNTHNYFHYEGSLTTPPCYESVLWFVMEDIIYVSKGQIERFRHLKQHVDEKHDPRSQSNTTDKKVPGTKHKKPAKYIKHNFRPIQSLNGRPVYYSNPSMLSNRMTSGATSKTVLSSGNDPKAQELLTHLHLTGVSGQNTSSHGKTDKTENLDLSFLGKNINLKQIGSKVPANKILSLGVTQNQIPQGDSHVSNMIFPHTNTGQISSKIGGSKTTSRLSIDFVNTNTRSANDKSGKTIKFVGTDSTAGLNGFDKRNEVKGAQAERFTKGNVIGTLSKGGGRSDSLQKQTTFTSMSNGSGTTSKNQIHNSRIGTTKKESNKSTKRAKILKFFANMFLKQAEILKRMQEQKVAQAAAAATSRQNPDYGHSTTIFSNPPFGSTRIIETGNSGFDNNQLFNRRGLGFVHPEPRNVIPVSIETPSWNNPPITAFAQDPKHFIQRQHFAYYDLLDQPIDQRSIIPYPGTKYNVIDPVPYGPIHTAPAKPINLPSTSKLEKSIASRKSKLKRKGFRRKKSHKNKTERRKWLVDVITDYVKLIKVLTKH